MQKTRASLILFFILISFHSVAESRQAPSMVNALEGADSKTLVIFDLDNTVMMPPQTLGGEEWYDYFIEKRTKAFEQEGLNPAQAKSKAIKMGLAEWNLFHKTAKVVPVEKENPELISSLQKLGAKTMALSARPYDLAQSTVQQLKSIGIDFSLNTLSNKKMTIPGKDPSLFYKGALLVGPNNNKGEVLVKFLKRLKVKPEKVIYVDNKLHHIENVEKALLPLKIPYFGRRHGAADKKIESMDKNIVEIQHKYFFGEVLSNEDAEKLVD